MLLRIILSVIFGILIPLIYGVIMAFAEDFVSERWFEMKFYNQSAPGILLAPITLPIYFDIFTKAERIMPFLFDTVWFRVSSFIIFNWFLYGMISYFALGYFKRFKKGGVSFSETPPSPPQFENNF